MKPLSFAAKAAWQLSAQEAILAYHPLISVDHLLMGILSLEKIQLSVEASENETDALESLTTETTAIEGILAAFELDSTSLRRSLRLSLGKGTSKQDEKIIHRSPECKNIFHQAQKLAESSSEVTCIHLLAAILAQPSEIFIKVMDNAGVNPNDLVDHVQEALKSAGIDNEEPIKVLPGATNKEHGKTHYLDRYGRDLTQAAREGRLGPYIGRRKELLQIIQTLARQSKNNPILVGEAGVGKTAIIEALALRVANDKDIQVLEGRRIVELNMGALVGGTKYRGEFEERLSNLLNEARNHPEVILFIDEIHNLIGAGRGEGSMDAANIMKPALARGDLHCIGATTILEYRRYIESDPALERRFEKINIDEPSPAEALEILKGLKNKWETHHQVHISDQALKAAVDLSIRFDCDHQLPDKAIDLVDKAGARIRIPFLSNFNQDKSKSDFFGEISELTIAQVLSEKINVPINIVSGHLAGLDRSRLLDLEQFLKSRIVGQDEAIERVCRRLLMAHAGLVPQRGPLAVFLFLGPTGVGKTEVARLLSEFLFGDPSDMIRLDMSEYMEEHSTAKLIGSPPGYVGHEEEGQLTGKLRSTPYSVVLLDEIEKAHPRVFDMFLQVFDEGRLTDAKGRTIDARNAIFVMTSNVITENHTRLGFVTSEKTKTDVNENIKHLFRTEFINRIDEQITFRKLDESDVRTILKPILEKIILKLEEQFHLTLNINEDAEIFLARQGYNQQFGVRELNRIVERWVQAPLSKLIISGEQEKHKEWFLTYSDESVSIISGEPDKSG